MQERALELQKRTKSAKKIKGIFSFLTIGSLVVVILLILFFILRPQPDNIPAARKADEFLRVGNTYYYDSSYVPEEVAEYWAQSRAIIGYIVSLIGIFFVSLISKIIWNKKYKSLAKALKEAKNVLKNMWK